MSKTGSPTLIAVAVLLSLCLSATVWAQTPAPEGCVDVAKTCVDADSPEGPISYNITLTNCGNVWMFCGLTDVLLHENIYQDGLDVGETVSFAASYYPDECGPSTNEVRATCTYKVGDDTYVNVYDEDFATCSVPCEGDDGCTQTQLYWKVHSAYGPASYDEAWAAIGEDSVFFLSGMSYYEVLWQLRRPGNVYYGLAHQYIAAELNVAAGASMPPEVAAAFSTATGLFGQYTPDAIGKLRWWDGLRWQFVRLARTLGDYNRGITGPGHCDYGKCDGTWECLFHWNHDGHESCDHD